MRDDACPLSTVQYTDFLVNIQRYVIQMLLAYRTGLLSGDLQLSVHTAMGKSVKQ